MSATTFASFNSNFGLTLIGTHEPDVRTLSMVLARTRGMFKLFHEFELVTTYKVLSVESTDSGWIVYIGDDVGKPTILDITVTYDDGDGQPVYNMKYTNYKREWN